MRIILLAALALFVGSASAGDFGIGGGKAYRLTSGHAGTDGNGLELQWLDRGWVFALNVFDEQTVRIDDKRIKVPEYAALSVMRRWSFDDGKTRLPPFIQAGLTFKESQSCHHALQTPGKNCNILVPSPVSFTFGLGFTAGSFEVSLRHTSNAGLKSPNGGQDLLLLMYRF